MAGGPDRDPSHRSRVSVVVSFIPTGGDESAKTKRITLLLKS
jgi:hypothetical protein